MHSSGSPEKANNFSLAIKKLFGFNKPFLIPIIIALVLSAGASILSIIGPDKLKDITNIIIDGLMTGIDMEEIKSIAIILIIFYSLSFIFNYVQSYIMAVVTVKSTKIMRTKISNKINNTPLSYFDKTTVGDTLSRVTNDVDTIGQTMNQSVGTLVSCITMFLGSIVMMFKTNWIMAITAILSSMIGFMLMMFILGKSQKYFAAVQKGLGDINGVVEETFTGHNIVKVYNAKDEVNKKFDAYNDKLYEDGKRSQFYSGLMMPLMNFIGNFGYVAVCIVGAMLALKGHISFGVIVAFMIYIRLFTQPLSQMGQSVTQLQSTAAASERVFEFIEGEVMSSEEDKTDYISNENAVGNIEFKHVKFGYDKKKTVIKDFSAIAKKGDKIAIVGPTGAGKTTLVNLLMRFYEIEEGSILIDGIESSKLTRDNIHELFVMVLQDTWLFEGTIKENIRYNKENITDEQIIDACKTVGLHHFIKTLPNGYDTVLSDVDSLSAGQKQLLTIARGMIENGPFLILDEATSSVDTRTEELVQKAMDKLTKGRTSFIIAHRLSTIKNADLILVLNEGNIVEQGNHEELLKLNGFYADLYNSQFQNN